MSKDDLFNFALNKNNKTKSEDSKIEQENQTTETSNNEQVDTTNISDTQKHESFSSTINDDDLKIKQRIEKKYVQYYLPVDLIKEIDKVCKMDSLQKTNFIEYLFKIGLDDYKKRKGE